MLLHASVQEGNYCNLVCTFDVLGCYNLVCRWLRSGVTDERSRLAAYSMILIASIFARFLARDVIYTSRAYATMSVSVCLTVCLSVTEVHWRIIGNLAFKFRSTFTAHCGRGACREEGRDHRREEWMDHLALC